MSELTPAITDYTLLLGIPVERSWYDCGNGNGNGYGVSVVYDRTCNPRYQVAAGLWMDRRPDWQEPTDVLHCTPERVHVDTPGETSRLIQHAAALPYLGSTEPPRRLLPDCQCWYCTSTGTHR